MTTGTDLADDLAATISGRIVRPGDADYDEARALWNGMIDRRPRLIVRASGPGDVAPTIAFARRTGLQLAIRGGGHNVAGNGSVDDGIVLDLRDLNGVEVDPDRRLVRVGAGATLGDIDRATQPFGLAVPIGVVSGTGIGGLTLGGGVGWLTRAYGLTIDNLVSADVVLATGASVRADATEHPDLFWGLRGGGGNFGVVTAFTFRAYPHGPDVFAGSLIYQAARWSEALRAYADWSAGLPDELTTLITFMVPPGDWDMGDQPVMLLGFAWAGADDGSGRAAIDRLRATCVPDLEMLDPTTWIAFQSAFDASLPPTSRAYWRNVWFDRLDDAVIDGIVTHAAAQTRVGTAADLHHMGGAFGRVGANETAFPDRTAGFWLNIYGFWAGAADDGPNSAWVKGFSDDLQPLAASGQYVNFLGRDEGDARAKALAVYGPAKYERLVAIKRRYDPDNVFRINHNIPPEG